MEEERQAMYVLVVYDVEVKRVGKVHKFLKRHLNWVQNSVFEGELTESQIEEVRIGLGRLMDKDSDSVLIYTAREERWFETEYLVAKDKFVFAIEARIDEAWLLVGNSSLEDISWKNRSAGLGANCISV